MSRRSGRWWIAPSAKAAGLPRRSGCGGWSRARRLGLPRRSRIVRGWRRRLGQQEDRHGQRHESDRDSGGAVDDRPPALGFREIGFTRKTEGDQHGVCTRGRIRVVRGITIRPPILQRIEDLTHGFRPWSHRYSTVDAPTANAEARRTTPAAVARGEADSGRGQSSHRDRRGASSRPSAACLYDLRRDAAGPQRESGDERPIADEVDEPWDAARKPVHDGERPRRERDHRRAARRSPGDARRTPPRASASSGFELVANRHALIELPELRRSKQRLQVQLADQDDLQQLLLVGLEIRQDADLLEHRQCGRFCASSMISTALAFSGTRPSRKSYSASISSCLVTLASRLAS